MMKLATITITAVMVSCGIAHAAPLVLNSETTVPDYLETGDLPNRDWRMDRWRQPFVVSIDRLTGESGVLEGYYTVVGSVDRYSNRVNLEVPPAGPFGQTETLSRWLRMRVLPVDGTRRQLSVSTGTVLPVQNEQTGDWEWSYEVPDGIPNVIPMQVTGYVYERRDVQREVIETVDLGVFDFALQDDSLSADFQVVPGYWSASIDPITYAPDEPVTFSRDVWGDGRIAIVSLADRQYAIKAVTWLPEPTSLLLAALGILAVLQVRKRRV